jgi:hypothetical protein
MVRHPREWVWSSYRSTAGQAPVPACLTVEEVLGQFGERRGSCQEKYREYVKEGLDQPTIWEGLEAQSLLGVEGFAEALKGHISGKEKLREVPRARRLIGRVSLSKLFGEPMGKAKRDRLMRQAVYDHGYSQMEVARHLNLHYSTVSRLINNMTQAQR